MMFSLFFRLDFVRSDLFGRMCSPYDISCSNCFLLIYCIFFC